MKQIISFLLLFVLLCLQDAFLSQRMLQQSNVKQSNQVIRFNKLYYSYV